jgi:uncharacterized protein involved in exopolysaccharide biosynthesis
MLANIPSSGSEVAQAPSAGAPPERPGAPIELRRLSSALRRSRRGLVMATSLALIVGAVLGKLAPRTYAASATVLWEPPTVAKTDPARELATLAQSVKLPANMLTVRERLGGVQRVEQLAKALDVTLGENSMLLTITGHENDPDKAAKLAQTAVEVFVDAQREGSRGRLREVVTALRQSLSQAEAEHDQSRGRYNAFRTQNHVDDFPTEVQAAIAEVARLRVSVNDAKVELGGIAARQEALRQAQARSPESVVLSRSEQNFDETRSGQIATELAELRSRFSSDHPRVQILEAELASLKARKGVAPTVAGQTVGRNSVRDQISAQVEESTAVRSAVTERSKALETLRHEAESRGGRPPPAAVTGVQGEAARLLADVKVNEEHVALLLKQLAMAEDDVRGASSAFQLVSMATPPEHSEKALGRIIAVVTPLLALILGAIFVSAREALRLRVFSGAEAAYFAKAPVLWATSWPLASAAETSALGREIADVCEDKRGVLGVTALGDQEAARNLGLLLLERLQRRGRRVCFVDAAIPPADPAASMPELLEGGAFGERLAGHARTHDLVVVLLPPAKDVAIARAAVRWLDGLLVVVESGTQEPGELGRLAEAASVRGRGMGLAVVRVAPELLPQGHRAVGDPSHLFRDTPVHRPSAPTKPRSPRPRRDPEPDGPSEPHMTLDEPFAPAGRRPRARKTRIAVESATVAEAAPVVGPLANVLEPDDSGVRALPRRRAGARRAAS